MFLIRNLRAYGNGWAFEKVDEILDETQTYRTNMSGEGMFRIDSPGTARESSVQLSGTCQFQTSRNRETARKQIKRYFAA